MAISLIGAATAAATSITIPGSYQAGDLIIIMAFRQSSTTQPGLGTGFISLANVGANTCGTRIGYRFATSGSEVSNTWVNATSMVCLVYRGAGAIGNVVNTVGNSTSIDFGAVTMQNTDGTSWVVGVAGHRDSGTDLSIAPTGMTNQTNLNTWSGGHLGGTIQMEGYHHGRYKRFRWAA